MEEGEGLARLLRQPRGFPLYVNSPQSSLAPLAELTQILCSHLLRQSSKQHARLPWRARMDLDDIFNDDLDLAVPPEVRETREGVPPPHLGVTAGRFWCLMELSDTQSTKTKKTGSGASQVA